MEHTKFSYAKRTKIFGMILFLVVSILSFLGTINAWSNNTFNNSLTIENLTFTGYENITRYLVIPNNTVLTSAYLNLSGFLFNDTSPYCYQESANTTNQGGLDGNCGLNYNGNYTEAPTWQDVNNTYDGDWTNFGVEIGGHANVTVHYKKPVANINTITWRISGDGPVGEQNISLPSECLLPTLDYIIVRYESTAAAYNFYCYNETSAAFSVVFNQPGFNHIIEEGIYWNISGVNLIIGNDKVWNYSGVFNQINNKTNNLMSIINSYLTPAYLVGANYVIPFIFHSNTAGILRYSDLIFSNNELIENSQSFNSATYETTTENFIINITYDTTTTSAISAMLVYDGTSYAGTKVGTGNTILFTRSIDVPTVTALANKSFYWNMALINSSGTIYVSSTTNKQTVNPIYFAYCNVNNVTVNTTFINFTYKDEMTYLNMNATIFSGTVFNYWLGNGSIKKSYNFKNTVENESTGFCFSPPDKSITSNYVYQVGGVGYITRTFNSIVNLTLSNITTNKLYYLILSADSGPVTIVVIDVTSGNVISGARVTVTRDIEGSTVTVLDGYTDDAGSIAGYLSSIVSYTISASKSGCGNNIKTITPVGSYNIQLNCGANATKFNSNIDGITYQRTPNTGVSQPGNITFAYYVASGIYPIVSSRFELWDNTNTMLAFNQTDVSSGYTWCNTTSCLLTIKYYAASGDNIKGRYYINLGNQTNNTYVLLEKDAYWKYIYINTNNSQQAWQKATIHFKEFMDVWGNRQTSNCLIYKTQATCTANPVCKWLNVTEWDPQPETNFSRNVYFCMLKDDVNKMEFNRILIIFFGMVIVLFVMGKGIGYEMTNPGSFVMFLSIVIVILSIGGMFTFSGLTPWEWFNQYIYAYICVTFSAGYNFAIARRYSA